MHRRRAWLLFLAIAIVRPAAVVHHPGYRVVADAIAPVIAVLAIAFVAMHSPGRGRRQSGSSRQHRVEWALLFP